MAELVLCRPGLRVVRGPDWEWGEQDGGEGHVGTVVEVGEISGNSGRAVVVQWDCGERPGNYRCGLGGKYDLRVLDSAPTGLSFPKLRCYGCRREGLSGLHWKCSRCSEYHLCSGCYMADHHSVDHQFNCITAKDGKRVKVLPRSGLRKVEAKGLFVNASVKRGRDWRWKDQDGGRGSIGEVVSIKNWKNETARSVAEVKWPTTGRINLYRAGHKGKIDLMCTVPGSGGTYYPEHLPILGSLYVPPGPKDFSSGDKIKCEVDVELLTMASVAGEGADDQVLMLLDNVGCVEEFLQNGDLYVRYPNNSLLPVSPEGATKVDVPTFHRGDVVRLIDDMAAIFSLQKGHGEWVDDMALSLGQVGVVLKVLQGTGDVRVAIGGRKWTMNPRCVVPAPDEAPPLIIDAVADIDMEARMQMLTLSHAMDPYKIVMAAAAGDIGTMRSILSESPDQVNTTYEGKTALHVAIEEGSPNAVKLLLEYQANMELQDKAGEKPLHSCAYVKSPECAKLLLDAGVDVNCKNAKDNTPLMVAAALGHYNVLKLLVTQPSIDVNAQDFSGKTALHHSISAHRTLSVAILLDHGADPTLFNFLGFAPIHDAAGLGFLVAIEEMLALFPHYVNFRRIEDENTALHIAAANDRLEVLKHLCTIPTIDLNTQNNRTHAPLHCAAIEGFGTIIEALVGYGADLNVTDLEGNTAMHIILIKKNAKPPSEELTPQIAKVQRDLKRIQGTSAVAHYMTLVCFLAQQGADVHLRNRRGQTALNMIPAEMTAALMNFVNDTNRGAFHGSLRTAVDGAAIVPPAENRPLNQQAAVLSSGVRTNSQTTGTHSQAQEVAESAPKHNHSNQERSQQEAITASSSSNGNTSLVKSLSDRKPHPSPQLRRDNIQLEQTLKEKAGFTAHHQPRSIHHSPPPPPPAALRGSCPDASGTAERTQTAAGPREDSNKMLHSDVPSSLRPLGGAVGGVRSGLSGSREQRVQQGWNQEKTESDSDSGQPVETAPLCFLCDEETSNVKFMPCGHTVMCRMCAKNSKKCPQCRCLVQGKIELSSQY